MNKVVTIVTIWILICFLFILIALLIESATTHKVLLSVIAGVGATVPKSDADLAIESNILQKGTFSFESLCKQLVVSSQEKIQNRRLEILRSDHTMGQKLRAIILLVFPKINQQEINEKQLNKISKTLNLNQKNAEQCIDVLLGIGVLHFVVAKTKDSSQTLDWITICRMWADDEKYDEEEQKEQELQQMDEHQYNLPSLRELKTSDELKTLIDLLEYLKRNEKTITVSNDDMTMLHNWFQFRQQQQHILDLMIIFANDMKQFSPIQNT